MGSMKASFELWKGHVFTKMASLFRFPKPRKREDLLAGIPKFQWDDLSAMKRIGNGSFGSVDFARYLSRK